MVGPKTIMEWARFYSDEWGACVIPLREGKMPAVRWAEYQRRRPTGEELERWFGGDSPMWGMALVCGEVSGNLVRLDFDDPDEYCRSLDAFNFAVNAPAFKSQRKGGGYGVVFKNDIALRKIPAGKFEGYSKLELMGEGSITVVPPTPGYEWISEDLNLPKVELPRIFLGCDLWRTEKTGPENPLDDELNDLLENTVKGGRDNALTRLVNILRSRNLGLETIKKIITPFAVDWGHGGEPWDEETIEKMVEEKFRRYEHQGARYGKPPAFEEEFGDTEEDYSVRQKQAEGPKPYLVDRLVLGEDMSNVVMAANAGEGKTTVCLGVALCMAQGRPVWGVLDVPRPLKVVFIDEEEVRSQIRETIDMMAEVYGRPKRGMLTGLSGKGSHYSIGNPKSLELLERRLDKIGPDFIFLDGWQWFVDNKVSDRDFVGPALAWWKRIRGKYGCGTWIIHHNKKMGAPQFRPADPLELATGAKLLMDQARTKLIYEQMTGDLTDYGHLQGRCGRAEWNPISIVLEYDQTTQSHRMILRAEGEELFDTDQVKTIWGERPAVRRIKGILNRLKRQGMNTTQVAEFFGVSHTAVSKWRSGQTLPSKDRLEQLQALVAEEGEQVAKPVAGGLRKDAIHIREMPSPIGVPIKNKLMNNVHVPSADRASAASSSPSKGKPVKAVVDRTHEGKPGPQCGRCPLRESAYVGGRGGAEGCVMLVGDGPGQTDAKSGKAYSGKAGIRLEKALRSAKIDPNLCRYANAVFCHVPKSRKPAKKALECCRQLLEKELTEYRPRMVITLGEIALKAFYPGRLRDFHGMRIDQGEYVLVPMYKPDAGDKSPELARLFVNDFYRLKDRVKMSKLEGDYRRAVEFTPANELVAVDTETTGLDLRSNIVGIGLCDTPGDSVYMSKENGIGSLRRHPPDREVMHNAKFDLGIFMSNGMPGIRLDNVDDSMLLAYAMNKKPLGLKGLVLQELNLEMRFFRDVLGNKATFADVDEREAVQYGAADPDATLRLWNHLWKRADSRERKLYTNIEKPLPGLLAKMQLNGVLVDIPYLEALQLDMDAKITELASGIERKFKVTQDIMNSPQKLAHYLYSELKLPVPYRTDHDAPSTEHDALERLKGKHEFIDFLLEYRRLSKLKSTFVDGVLERQQSGLIFPEFNQVGTTTGRMSSSGPNMQNLPKKADKSMVIRRAYIAPEGHAVVAFDNSQIDLRTLAWESKDPELMKIFGENADIHAETARAIYGEVSALQRRTAKTANFLVIFGGGYSSLAIKAGVTEGEARHFLDTHREKYPGIYRWIDKTHRFVLEYGYVETLYGRRRPIPQVFTGARAQGLRMAQNAPVQGGSSDVLKLQMGAVADLATPFAQIHDELDFYLLLDGIDERIAGIKAAMETVDCPFKLKVDVAVGSNFGEMSKWDARKNRQ